jgi:hypothetical protein
MLNGFLFITDAGGLPGGYSEDTLKNLAMIAKKQEVNLVIIEANFGDGMFTQLMKPILNKIHRVTVEEVKHSIQKERRIIDTLEPPISSHRLIVDRKVIENDYDSTRNLPPEKALRYQLIYQMSRITRQKGSLAHDDRLDAMAIAVAYWVEQMAQDVDKAIESRKDSKLRKELEDFMDHSVGRKPSPLKWF